MKDTLRFFIPHMPFKIAASHWWWVKVGNIINNNEVTAWRSDTLKYIDIDIDCGWLTCMMWMVLQLFMLATGDHHTPTVSYGCRLPMKADLKSEIFSSSPQVDAEQYYSELEEKLTDEFNAEKNRISMKRLGIAFVTFRDERMTAVWVLGGHDVCYLCSFSNMHHETVLKDWI